jgi:hypothetical protein
MKFASRKNNRAASIVEYAVLIIMFLAAIILMQKQIARTFFGRWKDMGDTFGYGELYDVNATLECGRYVPHSPSGWGSEIWYLQKCYECCLETTNTTCNDFSSANAGNSLSGCRGYGSALDQRGCCAKGCDKTTTNCSFQP